MGIREDTDIILHLNGGPGPSRRIWFEGARLRGVYPDERGIAGHVNKALKEPVPAIGQYAEIHPGFWHSGGGIEETIDEWRRDDVDIIVLDSEGGPFNPEIHHNNSTGFILSDDQPFTDNELEYMKDLRKVSLGETWLQGHACISIIHHLMD